MEVARHLRTSIFVAVSVIALAPSTAYAQEPTDPGAIRLADEALQAYQRGLELRTRDPEAAATAWLAARDAWQQLAQRGFNNPALHLNLGNTHYRLGDLGRAILHFRRGLWLDPSHTRLRENLARARRDVIADTPTAQPNAIARNLLALHYDTAPATRMRIAGAAGLLGWVILLARLRWRNGLLILVGGALAFLGAIAALSLVTEQVAADQNPPAVIIEQRVELRTGPGRGHEPLLSAPLTSGVELVERARIGAWAEVELGDGTRGYVPSASLERVLDVPESPDVSNPATAPR